MKNLNDDDLVDAWSKDQLPPPVVGRSKAAAAKAAKAEAAEKAEMRKAKTEAAEAEAAEKAEMRKAKAEAHEANKRKELAIKVQFLAMGLGLAQELRPLGVAMVAAKRESIVKGSERAEARLDKFASIESELLSRLVTATSPDELREVGRKLDILGVLRMPIAPQPQEE